MQATLFEAFLLNVICANNKALFDYLWNWIAHLMQKPEKLPGVALVLQGNAGIGKYTFIDILVQLIGKINHAHLYNSEDLLIRFNATLANKLLITIDETTINSNNYTCLKQLVSGEYHSVELRGHDPFLVKNFMRVIIESNEKPAVNKMIDRRFVLFSIADSHQHNIEYFKAIYDELIQVGYEALKNKLMTTDITNFDPRQLPTGV